MGPIVPVQQQLFLGTSGDKIGSLAEEKALSSQISMCIPGAEQHKTPPPDSDHQLPHTPSLSQALQKKQHQTPLPANSGFGAQAEIVPWKGTKDFTAVRPLGSPCNEVLQAQTHSLATSLPSAFFNASEKNRSHALLLPVPPLLVTGVCFGVEKWPSM